MESRPYKERRRELCICCSEKMRARGDWIIVFNYVKDNHVEEGDNLFTAALETRTRNNGFKLWERRFHLNSRKPFLTVRAVHAASEGGWSLLHWKFLGGDWMSTCQERVISRPQECRELDSMK